MTNELYQKVADFYKLGWLNSAAYYAKLAGDMGLAKDLEFEANENYFIKKRNSAEMKFIKKEQQIKGEEWIPTGEEKKERLLENIQLPLGKKKTFQQCWKEVLTV